MSYIGQGIVPVTGNVEINDADGIVINPATEESLRLLQRMVKLLESQSSTDIGNRQRINIDTIAAGVTLPTVTTVTGVTTVATVTTVASMTNLVTLAGYDQEQFLDVARNTYSNAIRNKLTFS
jgi:hypothetical protein